MSAAIAALVVAAVYPNAELITEAYGSGPPYFGRTVNLDKWSDPLPILLAVDALVLVVVIVAYGARNGRRRKPRP